MTTTATQSTGGTAAASPESEIKTATPLDGAVNKTTFLKLLVAQLQHQNPLNPADGTEFLTQLAGFSQLEQMLGMREDLDAIRTSLGGDQPGASSDSGNATPATGGESK